MPSLSIERQQTDIIKSILAINNSKFLSDVKAYISRRKSKENAKVQEIDDTCMTKEEFFAMIDKRMEEYEKGNYVTMLQDESLDDFLSRVSK